MYKMKKLFAFLLGSGILFFINIENAWCLVSYTLTDLGTLSGYTYSCRAEDINNNGQIVGYCFNSLYESSHGFLWQSGSGIQDIGTLGPSCAALGINNYGQVVGSSTKVDGNNYAFLWQRGIGMQDLGYGYATGINDSGQVAGYPGFIWHQSSGMQYVGISNLTGINKSGQVAGWGPKSSNPQIYDAYIWQSNTGLEDIGGLPGGQRNYTTDINDLGQVVGYSQGSIVTHAFLWQSGTGMEDLGSLGGTSNAMGINNNGQVVGQSTDTRGKFCAFLWQSAGGMVDLNSLIDASSGWRLCQANAINDNGWIVGWGVNPNHVERAFLLTPIPEPSTLALLSIGVIGMLAHTWRRRET
jgi:probable HAF family extracellular repeat protein